MSDGTGRRRARRSALGQKAVWAAAVLGCGAAAVLAVLAPRPPVLWWCAAAVLLTVLPLLVPVRMRPLTAGAAAVVLLAGIGLALLSIGPYFLPALAALAVGAIADATARRR
ncbi:hypothetical protein [Streptomonospora litoralis]|uniref:hypothetical protein n=1 Tax=Streptomonospora litoralis TaxID=2498135 RepID=UPI001035A572|nr:hypothetical protein [Streptomonospora litoralis]